MTGYSLMYLGLSLIPPSMVKKGCSLGFPKLTSYLVAQIHQVGKAEHPWDERLQVPSGTLRGLPEYRALRLVGVLPLIRE